VANITVRAEQRHERPHRLQSLPLWRAVLLFGALALVFRLCVYGLLPTLIGSGVLPFWAFLASYGLVLALMIVAALVAFRLEGYAATLDAFAQRFRFHRLGGRGWLWALGLFVVGFVATGALIPTGRAIASIPAFAPPTFLRPVVNPLAPQSLTPTQFMGVPLRGAWWVAVVYLLFLMCLNVLGEEIWFRQSYALVQDVWTAAGRPGKPRFVAGMYYALGPDAAGRGGDYLRHYYAFLGPMAETIATSILTSLEALRGAIAAFAEVGVDELVLWPCTPDLDQIDRLADLVG
jgi:hypothetical protein